MMRSIPTAILLATVALPVSAARAEVTNFTIDSVAPAFQDGTFGVGGYEIVMGTASIALDPRDARNAVIADIDLMPRDAAGKVVFDAPVSVLRPIDPAAGTGRILYDVVNRGRISAMMFLNDAVPPGADFTLPETAGDGYLMDQGYSVVWSGWQSDITGPLALPLPPLPGITGRSREEMVFAKPEDTTLALTYPMADPTGADATLTVREREADQRITPEGLSFTVTDDRTVEIARPEGMADGAIYEFIYTAKDPVAMGLGLAATRDVMSFLHDNGDILHQPADAAAYAFGSSQSGRFLKELVHLGFNADEAGNRVFDGLIVHVAGSRRIFLNARFAQAGRYSRQHEDHTYPGDEFPFSYFTSTDPLSGATGGILEACTDSGTCPAIMHIDSAAEAYQARASLVVTDPSGEPAEMPDNVRVYLAAGVPHGVPVGTPSRQTPACSNPTNNLAAGALNRAALHNLDAWVSDGVVPPDSRYPSRADDTLIDPTSLDFSGIPGVQTTPVWNGKSVVDHAHMPPVAGDPYPVFLPRLDADGHAVAGIRLPQIDAGLGSYLGWNTRPGAAMPKDLCSTTGSFIAFAPTSAEAEAAGDTRPSLQDRYPDRGAYLAAVDRSVEALVEERLILPRDGAAIRAAAEAGPGPQAE